MHSSQKDVFQSLESQYQNSKSVSKVMVKLNRVPIRYFCAKLLSSNCLNLAIDLAVKTKAIEGHKFKKAKMTIIMRSSFPMMLP